MKAIIIKNNEFQTIGFEVTASGKTLFTWGISSTLKSNFQKEINTNDWMSEIFELVKIKSAIQEQSRFKSKFFDITTRQGFIKEGQGVNFENQDNELKRLNEKLENIIKNII